MAQSLKARNGPEGILPGQFPAVLRLLESDLETQKSLCDHVRVEQGTMANTLKRMERSGMIQRRARRHDRRQYSVNLTPKGRELAIASMKNAGDVNRVALAGLSAQERELLRGFLVAMVASLEEDLAGRAPKIDPEPAKSRP